MIALSQAQLFRIIGTLLHKSSVTTNLCFLARFENSFFHVRENFYVPIFSFLVPSKIFFGTSERETKKSECKNFLGTWKKLFSKRARKQIFIVIFFFNSEKFFFFRNQILYRFRETFFLGTHNSDSEQIIQTRNAYVRRSLGTRNLGTYFTPVSNF
jgi:hypothetical protein